MAKIEWDIKEDSTLVKFEAVRVGEVFIQDKMPLYKLSGDEALNMSDSDIVWIQPNDLVTYVKKAELNLTI